MYIVGYNGLFVYSDNAFTWTRVAITTGDECYDIAYGNGKYVIASRNRVYFGSNLDSLSVIDITGTYRGICFDGEKFVAVGVSGVAGYSSDGELWTNIEMPTTRDLYAIVFANGKYVACGKSLYCVYSDNAMTWTQSDITLNANLSLAEIVYYGNKFIAGGKSSLYYSENAANWSRVQFSVPGIISPYIRGFAAGNNIVFAGDDGLLGVSADGLTWQVEKDDRNWTTAFACYGKGVYVIAAFGLILYSKDGYEWTDSMKALYVGDTDVTDQVKSILGIT